MRKKIVSEEIIVALAERLIKEEGLNKCSMRRISKELGIAVGTVFNYFESREDLLGKVFLISWNKTIESIRPVIDEGLSTMDALKSIASILCRDINDRNGLGAGLKDADSQFWVKGRNYLDATFLTIFENLLLKDDAITDANCMAKWLLAIIMMMVKDYRVLSEEDWVRIERMLYL